MTHLKPKVKKKNKVKVFKEQFFDVTWKRLEFFDAPGLKRARGGVDFKLVKGIVKPSKEEMPDEVVFSFDIVHEEDKKKKPKILRQTIVVVDESQVREASRFYKAVRETWLAHPFTVRNKGFVCPGKPPVAPHTVAKPDNTPGVIEVEGTASRPAETKATCAVYMPDANVLLAGEQEHGIQLWAGATASSYTMVFSEAGAGSIAALDTAYYVDEHVVGVAYASGRVQVIRAAVSGPAPFLTFETELGDGQALTHIAMSAEPVFVFAAGGSTLAAFSVAGGDSVGTVTLPGTVTSLTTIPSNDASQARVVVAMAGGDGALHVYDTASLDAGPVMVLPGLASADSGAQVEYIPSSEVVVASGAAGKLCAWNAVSGELAGEFQVEVPGDLVHLTANPATGVVAVADTTGSALTFITTPDLTLMASIDLSAPLAAAPTFAPTPNNVLFYDQGDSVLVVDPEHPFAYGAVAVEGPVKQVLFHEPSGALSVLGVDGVFRFVSKAISRTERCSREFEHKVVALQRWKEKVAKDKPKMDAYKVELAAYTARLDAFVEATTVRL